MLPGIIELLEVNYCSSDGEAKGLDQPGFSVREDKSYKDAGEDRF